MLRLGSACGRAGKAHLPVMLQRVALNLSVSLCFSWAWVQV